MVRLLVVLLGMLTTGRPGRQEPAWYFSKVPEPKGAKNRVHLDIHVNPGGKAEEASCSRLRRGAVQASAGDGTALLGSSRCGSVAMNRSWSSARQPAQCPEGRQVPPVVPEKAHGIEPGCQLGHHGALVGVERRPQLHRAAARMGGQPAGGGQDV